MHRVAVGAILFASHLFCISDDTIFAQAYLFRQQDKLEQALSLYQTLIDQDPHNINAWYHKAHALKELGNMHDAIDTYNHLLTYDSCHARAHFGLSQCHLALGEFEKGWHEFTWRSPDVKKFPLYTLENKDLTNKKILIRAEWGLGDSIQFIRYAQLLKKQGATVIVQTHQPLVPLFSLCTYIDHVIPVGTNLAPHDLQIPLLNLPYAFNTRRETIPTNIPYLQTDSQLVKEWQTKLAPDTSYKIGICWHGGGDVHAPASLNKNIPLSSFALLAELPNVHLYSLQQITGLHEIDSTSFDLHLFNDLDQKNGRFMDTAAIMHALDLVITIDTSIAHLAGALGIPVWLLLPYRTDWRWLLDQTKSPWYPTMRLFRQARPGDWQGVMQTITQEAAQLIKKKYPLNHKGENEEYNQHREKEN